MIFYHNIVCHIKQVYSPDLKCNIMVQYLNYNSNNTTEQRRHPFYLFMNTRYSGELRARVWKRSDKAVSLARYLFFLTRLPEQPLAHSVESWTNVVQQVNSYCGFVRFWTINFSSNGFNAARIGSNFEIKS